MTQTAVHLDILQELSRPVLVETRPINAQHVDLEKADHKIFTRANRFLQITTQIVIKSWYSEEEDTTNVLIRAESILNLPQRRLH